MLLAGGELADASAFLIRLTDLDFELSRGFSITLDDISELTFRALRILDDEKAKMRQRGDNMEIARNEAHNSKKTMSF